MRLYFELPWITITAIGCVSCVSSNTLNSGVSGEWGVSENTVITGIDGNRCDNCNSGISVNDIKEGKSGDSGITRNNVVSSYSRNTGNTLISGNSENRGNTIDSGVSDFSRFAGVKFQGFLGEPVQDPSNPTLQAPRRFERSLQAGVVPVGDFAPLVLPIRFAPVAGIISSEFGPRGSRVHKGIDFKAAEGSPVFAYSAGLVVRAVYSYSFGNVVEISHGGGWSTLYAHLSRIVLAPGEVVSQGALLGAVGQTGHATGPHVHFEIRFKGQAVNPLEKRRTVLLASK